MAKFTCVLPGAEMTAPEEDFRGAKRVEQYRLSERALYIPAGLRWTYLPFDRVTEAEESHRSITAGKCVAVTEKRPSLLLKTAGETFTVNLEKTESRDLILAAVRKAKQE